MKKGFSKNIGNKVGIIEIKKKEIFESIHKNCHHTRHF